MGKSYRIRTELGINKQIQVNLEQDYDFLEILSLKFRPEEIYPRSCADFGVITGRVIANGGYGIPNAKISVFVPISDEDALNPVISTLYPYRKVSDVNEDGYRYNLLPYIKQHAGHTPTGTFPSINDVLVDNTVIEIYDKYYKFTVKTNESGDYMIFGVPLGNQTVFMDLDLSDMGPFSLSPQDLIRMGRATQTQIDGTLFKASENLDSLPQIVSEVIEISVEPFWGQEDLCQTKIHRLDFDLRKLGIEIEPTSVFIGSMISDADKYKIKRRCKPASEGGDLCNLVAGPGEILAIRQTIFLDDNNRPVLEEFRLENGGRVIDEDGTWVVDLPMNLDFVTTNEFGETILSANPSIGIPTSAKYRFKVKWQQSSDLSEGTKRGYYLVPNIREYGWTSSDDDPVPTAQDTNQPPSTIPFDVLASYAFSLDWNDYGNTGTTIGNQMIFDAINCVDKFYVFKYKKLYTVSQLIDQYHNGTGKQRFIGIKEITDTRCESENNKFPTTDGVRNTNLFYTISSIFLLIIYFLIFGLLIPIHLIAFISRLFCRIYNSIIIPACRLLRSLGLRRKPCPEPIECKDILTLRLPMLTYPDCSLCEDCKSDVTDSNSAVNDEVPGIEDVGNTGLLLAPIDVTSVNLNTPCLTQGDVVDQNVALVLQAGRYFGQPTNSITGNAQDSFNSPWRHTSMYINRIDTVIGLGSYLGEDRYFACELPFAEKINLFNTKAKYFDGDFGGSFVNGGIGGANQIKVYVEPNLNNSATTYHLDNTYILIVDPETLENYTQGRLVSFQDFLLSNDFNVTGNSGNSIIGSGNTGLTQINVTYANPQDTPLVLNPTPLSTTYNVNFTEGSPEYKYPTDIEYFQVITGMTYTEFMSKVNPSGVNDLASRYLNYIVNIKRSRKLFTPLTQLGFPPYNFTTLLPVDSSCPPIQPYGNLSICDNTITDVCSLSAITAFNNYQNFGVIILNRGVDVNTERVNISYDLSRIFGYTTYTDNNIVNGNYKLNVPIQPNYRLANHNNLSNNANDGDYFNRFIYYPSYNTDFNTSFSSYTTNLHTYYSSLDLSSVTSNFTVNNNYPWTQLTVGHITVAAGSQLELRTGGPISSAFIGCGGYFETTFGGSDIGEYIEGGSYTYQRPEGYFVYDQNCVSTPSSPNANNCDNNEETFIYFAPKYDSGNTLTVSASTRLVFRSDRLPTSTNLDQDFVYFGLFGNQNNSAPGQQNNNFFIYLYGEDSTGEGIGQPWLDSAVDVEVTSDVDGNTISDTQDDYDNNSGGPNISGIINSLSCESLVDLSCYQNGTPATLSETASTDNCNRTGPNIAVDNGCYILVKRAILDLNPLQENNDFAQLGEWVGRLRLNLGACLGVISHTFVNSWVNGVLYHFAIKNNRFFDNQNNQPYSLYCSDVVILDPNTNNYYYRSSPYNTTFNQFIGKSTINSVQDKNLLYPTTIMDLGPLNSYTNELIYGPEYEGYVANKLKPTSYQDVTEILQLFFLSRLTNANSLALALGVGQNSGVAALFKNQRGDSKKRIDGDYAQSIQINSQFGVFEFSPDQYNNSDIYFGGNADGGLLGIFFDGDNQNRDLISPRRLIFSESPLVGQQIPIFTQKVPYYKWYIEPNTSLIFGNQNNDWSMSIGSHPYQLLDRISSDFFRGNANSAEESYRGFITNVNPSGTNISLLGSSGPNPTIIGGPWYFYFGLKNAATAIDKFYLKYVE